MSQKARHVSRSHVPGDEETSATPQSVLTAAAAGVEGDAAARIVGLDGGFHLHGRELQVQAVIELTLLLPDIPVQTFSQTVEPVGDLVLGTN